MVRKTITTILTAIVLVAALASTANAQDSEVVILKFETFESDAGVVEDFYSTLESGIDDHPDLKVKKGGELTIQDLILTAGCDAPTAKCLGGLKEVVGADQLVFGSIQQSDDVFLFTIRNFDFAEGAFVREVTDQTVQGDLSEVKRALPAIVDNFLYGPVGTLEISVVGAKEAEILFNGEKMGFAPTTLENLPLGEHAVTLRTDDGEEKTETIVLRHNEPGSLEFTFGEPVEEIPEVATDDAPSTLPGWILVGVGVVGVGVGVVGLIQESGVNSDFDALCSKPGNVCDGSNASLSSPADAAEAQDLTDQGSSAQTLQLIGFSVGGAAIVAGAILLVRAYSYEAPPAEGTADKSPSFQFSVAPQKGGAVAGMNFTF